MRHADAQAPPQTYLFVICILAGSLGYWMHSKFSPNFFFRALDTSYPPSIYSPFPCPLHFSSSSSSNSKKKMSHMWKSISTCLYLVLIQILICNSTWFSLKAQVSLSVHRHINNIVTLGPRKIATKSSPQQDLNLCHLFIQSSICTQCFVGEHAKKRIQSLPFTKYFSFLLTALGNSQGGNGIMKSLDQNMWNE